MEKILLEKHLDIDYCVCFLPENKLTPFVCGFAPVYFDDGSVNYWNQGHYFTTLSGAAKYIDDLKKRKEMK